MLTRQNHKTKIKMVANGFAWLLLIIASAGYLWSFFCGLNHYDRLGLDILGKLFLSLPFFIFAAFIKIIVSVAIKAEKSTILKEVAVILVTLVFLPIIVGLIASPFRENSLHDVSVSQELFEIDLDVIGYYQKNEMLPDNSDVILAIMKTYNPDISRSKNYFDSGETKFEKIDESHFRVCGNFKSKSRGFSS